MGWSDGPSSRRAAPATFHRLYPDDMPLKDKIEAIVTLICGGDGVDYDPAANWSFAQYEPMGWGHLPIAARAPPAGERADDYDPAAGWRPLR